MSYNVGLHSYGGSAGEALDPQEMVNVSTLEEAKLIEKAVNTHPGTRDVGVVITEVVETVPVKDALDKFFKNYLYEEFEWEGCEDLTDAEYYAELERINAEHIAKFVPES